MAAEKVGAVVLATDQGLGYLAKAFYDHGLVDKVWIKRHSTRENHVDWYKAGDIVDYEYRLLDECTTILFFETPFNWKLIPMARERGIKTVLMPMYECTHFPFPYEPDLLLCPSALDFDSYPEKNRELVTVPVEVAWKKRERARVFIHNAGNGGLGGRNGTKELIEAMEYVRSDLTLIIRSQVPLRATHDPRIKVEVGTIPAEKLWSHGDVFIFPEKFNGLSLPLQEAYAAGMLVMAGNRYPMNTWLPNEPLIPVARYSTERIAVPFESAHYAPESIAACMDAWYDKDISAYSEGGRAWAEKNSWNSLKETYRVALSQSSAAPAS